MSAPMSSFGPHPALPPNAQLRRAVLQRIVLEQAKGALILHFRIDAETAFDLLRQWSRETGSSVPVVAETLVRAVCLGDDAREWDPAVLDHLTAALEHAPPLRSVRRGRQRVPGPRLEHTG